MNNAVALILSDRHKTGKCRYLSMSDKRHITAAMTVKIISVIYRSHRNFKVLYFQFFKAC